VGQEVVSASHRWFGLGGELLYEERLWTAPNPAPELAPC
jgi:hypothetical protein